MKEGKQDAGKLELIQKRWRREGSWEMARIDEEEAEGWALDAGKKQRSAFKDEEGEYCGWVVFEWWWSWDEMGKTSGDELKSSFKMEETHALIILSISPKRTDVYAG